MTKEIYDHLKRNSERASSMESEYWSGRWDGLEVAAKWVASNLQKLKGEE